MTSLSLLNPNIPNFHNLALFICHLFVDGQFRSGHIIHDSSETSAELYGLIPEIEVTCPNSIPWLSNDVSTNGDHSTFSSPWKQNQSTDDILQLIFIDPEHLPTNTDHLKDTLTFYRLFVFYSADEVIFSDRNTKLSEIRSAFMPSSVIVNFDGDNVYVYGPPEPENPDVEHMCYKKQGGSAEYDRMNMMELFEKKFKMAIKFSRLVSCQKDERSTRLFEILDGIPYFANFFYANLNAKYMNISVITCVELIPDIITKIVQPKYQKIYKELTIEDEQDRGQEMEKNDQTKMIHFAIDILDTYDSGVSSTTTLYPYHSTDIIVLYFHAADSTRDRYLVTASKFGNMIIALVSVFILLAAAVLCFVRRRLHLKRDGFISSYIDVNIAVFGGGNLSMRHKYERCIFGILLFGFFFMNSFWVNAFLYTSFVTFDGSVQTFHDLAKLHPPIFISPGLKTNEQMILSMLRNRIGRDIDYQGIKYIHQLVNHNQLFAYVSTKPIISMMKINPIRNFDLLQENLGSLNAGYFLTSAERVPDRIVRKINEKANLLMQSGLDGFYHGFATFMIEIGMGNNCEQDDSEEKPLTLQQLKHPFVIHFILLAICCVAFFIEIIVHAYKRWKCQRNNRVSQMEMGTFGEVAERIRSIGDGTSIQPGESAGPINSLDNRKIRTSPV